MTTLPRCRWFRFSFSLRTLFAALTVFGCWLGWNTNTVSVRNQTRNWVAEHHGWFSTDGSIFSLAQQEKDAQLTWIRRALGDKAAVLIELPIGAVSLDEIHKIEAAFPEADVAVGMPDGPEPSSPLRDDGVKLYNWPPNPPLPDVSWRPPLTCQGLPAAPLP